MLSHWLFELSGMSIFEGRLFRVGIAALSSFFLVLFLMPPYIKYLQNLDATSDFDHRDGTKSPPIMGGLLLVIITSITSIAFCHPNSYVISTLIIMVAYAIIGGIDIRSAITKHDGSVAITACGIDCQEYMVRIGLFDRKCIAAA